MILRDRFIEVRFRLQPQFVNVRFVIKRGQRRSEILKSLRVRRPLLVAVPIAEIRRGTSDAAET